MKNYILDDEHQVKAVSHDEWVEWTQEAYESQAGFEKRRRVAITQIDGDCHVSTVFLGIDHDFSGKGPPVLFETMVFGGENDSYQDRYCTWDEAIAGHQSTVDKIMSGELLND